MEVVGLGGKNVEKKEREGCLVKMVMNGNGNGVCIRKVDRRSHLLIAPLRPSRVLV